jgi:hypothetical protein
MPEEIVSVGDLIDIIVDWILEEAEIHDFGELGDLGDRVDVGDYPVFEQQLEVIATSEKVREAVAKRMSEAQAHGRAFPLPTAREVAAARERALARRQRRS